MSVKTIYRANPTECEVIGSGGDEMAAGRGEVDIKTLPGWQNERERERDSHVSRMHLRIRLYSELQEPNLRKKK